jgi:DNA-binding XRE family transcriptional regulator
MPPSVNRKEQPVSESSDALEIVEATIKSNRIKQVLAAKKITQEELSRRVGVSYRHINRLALGRSEPSLLLAQKIAIILDEPVEKLFQASIRTRKVARAA